MKYLFILLLYISCIISANAQVAEYYSEIHLAERKIIESDFKAAVSYYYKAAKIKSLLGADLLNATLASAKLHLVEDVLFFAKGLAAKGIGIGYFQNIPLLKPFLHQIDSTIIQVPLLSSINKKYRKVLIEMVENDQRYLTTTESRNIHKKAIDSIMKSNAIRLVDMIRKFGFPSEELTGLGKDNINPLCAVIIIHQSSGDKQIINFSSILKRAIYKGQFDNRLGSVLIELSDGRQNMIYNPISLIRARFDTVTTVKSVISGELEKKIRVGFQIGVLKKLRILSGLNSIKDER